MSRNAIESCTLQLHSWRPFGETLDSNSANPYVAAAIQGKRPCRADRATSFSVESIIDMSKLSLFDDDKPLSFSTAHKRWFARKRRRRGDSRSVSGRSSDLLCCSVGVSAGNGTCSDFLMATGGTDSSGELFGESNWASDVSAGYRMSGNCDIQGNESGYGSEPGYRGDVELEYGDEFDEEEDDQRALFWGEECRDNASHLERVGENSLQKGHHRCRRKKQDPRMGYTLR